jgi:hypothetical protein
MPRLTCSFPVRSAAGAVALVGAAVLLAPAAHAAAPDDAIASATYGNAEIWLQRKPTDHKQRELVYQPRTDAAPQVLNVRVPERERTYPSDAAEQLTLGRDRAGQLVVIVTSRTGLYWTRVSRPPKLHHVPGTTKRDNNASLFRGRIAFDTYSHGRASVKAGSLVRGATRTLWTTRLGGEWYPDETVIGAGGAVAWINFADGAEAGLFDAMIAPPRGHVIDVWPRGDHHTDVSLSLSTDGRRLTVWGRSVVHYELPSGRRLRD